MLEWFTNNREWVFSGVGVAVVFVLLPAIWKWSSAQRAPLVVAYWKRRKALVDAAIDRIKREAGNLQQIEDGKVFKSEAHREAVEVSSFELLSKELVPMTEYWSYQRLVRIILAEIKTAQLARTKSVARLAPLIESLHRQLRADRCHTRSA